MRAFDHLSLPSVMGTGFVALDIVIAEKPQSNVYAWAGGTCANVLTILSSFGWDAFPIARLNGDVASKQVISDFNHWGVHLEFVACSPTAHTPIVVERIWKESNGQPTHRFLWSCPKCGCGLPSFKPVTRNVIDLIEPALERVSVFFFDRVSRAALSIARIASSNGSVIVFEPSMKGNTKLFKEALNLAHIVKYSNQRLGEIEGIMVSNSSTIVEIQTLGELGLRYRHRFRHKSSDWRHLCAIPVPKMVDSCGSGDWVTAGLLAKTCAGGIESLREGGARGLRNALRFGQELASQNCMFEGARGCMYDSDNSSQASKSLDAFRYIHFKNPESDSYADAIGCPACLPATM